MLRPLILLLLTIASVRSEDFRAERLWTGTNGHSFRGMLVRLLEKDTKVEIAATAGKFYTVSVDNLSETDQRFIQRAIASRDGGQEREQVSDPGLFTKFPEIPRNQIPLLGKPQGVDWINNHYAIGTFLVWWDASGWLEVPRHGDLVKKAIWANRKLERFIDPRKSKAARTQEIMDGLAGYFAAYHKDDATWRMELCPDLRPETVRRCCQGPAACLIYTRVGDYGVWWPVIDVTANGEFQLAWRETAVTGTWIDTGKVVHVDNQLGSRYEIPQFDGTSKRWQPIAPTGGKATSKPYPTGIIRIRDSTDLPQWLSEAGPDLLVYPSSPMVVFRPYPLKDKGELPPPPADPLFGLPGLAR